MYLYDADGFPVARVLGYDNDGFPVIVEPHETEPEPDPWDGWTDEDYTHHAQEAEKPVPGDMSTADPADTPAPATRRRRKTA